MKMPLTGYKDIKFHPDKSSCNNSRKIHKILTSKMRAYLRSVRYRMEVRIVSNHIPSSGQMK